MITTHEWNIRRRPLAGTRNGCPSSTTQIIPKEFVWKFAGEYPKTKQKLPFKSNSNSLLPPETSIGPVRCRRYSRTASKPSVSRSTSTGRCWLCTRTANCGENISVCPHVASAHSLRCKKMSLALRSPSIAQCLLERLSAGKVVSWGLKEWKKQGSR